MGKLVFIGLGLYDQDGISLRGLKTAKNADNVFVELHTNLMRELNIDQLEDLIGKKVTVLSRRSLEEESGVRLLKTASKKNVVLLVPGDPLIATTHVDLRIRAEKAKIRTEVIHGSSIISAAIGLSGLQNYKFGRSVTIPFTNQYPPSETPYNVVKANQRIGLHTLCFLDIQAEEKRHMTIKEGLEMLRIMERKKKDRIITENTLVVGIAGAGSTSPKVKAGILKEVLCYDFNILPHTLIFPGKLHFMEVEALIALANASENIRNLER
jgi:diphthine synthase